MLYKMQQCSVCEKTFTRKANRIRHERNVQHKHGGPRRVKCSICFANLQRNTDFTRHNQAFHDNKALMHFIGIKTQEATTSDGQGIAKKHIKESMQTLTAWKHEAANLYIRVGQQHNFFINYLILVRIRNRRGGRWIYSPIRIRRRHSYPW